MTNNRDNIDDYFREGLNGYRVEPSAGLWKKIEGRFFPSSGMWRTVTATSIILFILAGSALVTWWSIPRNAIKENTKIATTLENENIPAAPPASQADPFNENQHTAIRNEKIKMPAKTPQPAFSQELTNTEPGIDNIELTPDNTPIKQLSNNESINKVPLGVEMPSQKTPIQNELSNISSLEESNNAFRRDEIDTYNMTIKSGMKLTRPGTNTGELVYQKISIQLPIYKTLKNEYARTYELSFGATFMPSVIFYDPNPYNTGWGGAFDLTYSRNRFNAYAGVGISRFKDKGSWQVNYETYDSVGYFNNINSFRVDPANPGKVIFETSQETVYDSVPHVVIEEKTNIYTYVDIPVGIGLTFLSNKRWSLMARTGIIYSLMVGKREPTASIDVQAASEIRFNRKVPSRVNSTWRFTAGLEVGYLLTDRLTIRLEPTYEQYLNSIYMNSPNYQAKKPYLIGVNVGLRYRIK